MAEFDRRDIKLPKTHDLPQLLASWRARETPKNEDRAKILALTVRACTFVDVADFCSALFANARKRRSHVVSTEASPTGVTLLVDARQRDATENVKEFCFEVPGGAGQFSRSGSRVLVFVRMRSTTTFIVSQDEQGIQIAFIDHKAA